jgi:hypothetical protein
MDIFNQLLNQINSTINNVIRIPGLAAWQITIALLVLLGVLGYVTFNLLVIRTFFKEIVDFLKDTFKVFLPVKWDSAKTLILLGFFSWAMSLISGPVLQNMIAIAGWIFLIAGVHWVMHEEKALKSLLTINGFFVGPWVTGALISYFLFASPLSLPPIAIVLWPVISAAIAAAPRFIFYGPKFGLPVVGVRPDLAQLLLTNLLLSCWLQLCFSTQTWLQEYPSLQVENMQNSAFVVRLQNDTDVRSRGVDVLQRAENELILALTGTSWPETERWLLSFDQQVRDMSVRVRENLPATRENPYWQLKGRVLAGEYNVQLYALWMGPSADAQGYYLSKVCQISKVTGQERLNPPPLGAPVTAPAAVGTATVQCGPVEGPFRGAPELATQRVNPATPRR